MALNFLLERIIEDAKSKYDAKRIKQAYDLMGTLQEHIANGFEDIPLKEAKDIFLRFGTVGERIYHLRREKGLKGIELAEMVGIGSSYLTKIEKGKQTGSTEVLTKIANALEIDFKQLTAGTIDSDTDEIDESDLEP